MSLRHALLGLLAGRTASGYDLLKGFDSSLANVWPATQSQVYGELGKLADSGLIEVVGQGPRGRKDYALTENGLAELRRWLGEFPEPQRRNEALLRVFFMSQLEPDQRVAFFEYRAEQAAARHKQLEQVLAAVDWDVTEPITRNGRIALEYGLRLTAMTVEWAEWAAKHVDQ